MVVEAAPRVHVKVLRLLVSATCLLQSESACVWVLLTYARSTLILLRNAISAQWTSILFRKQLMLCLA